MIAQGPTTSPRYSPGTVVDGWGGGRREERRVRGREAVPGQIPHPPSYLGLRSKLPIPGVSFKRGTGNQGVVCEARIEKHR